MVHPANVEQITRFVSTVEPSNEGDSVLWRESFMNHFPNSTIAAVCLQSARTMKELTQKQLAELTGIPQRHISEMENSKRNIGKERAIRLAEVLDTDYRVFL
jgi:DNA-binding XRE family transcriptional regulator